MTWLVVFVNLFVSVFEVLLLARVLLSWFNPNPEAGFGRWLVEITEPLLAPFRLVLPRGGVVDWAPLLAFISLQLLQVAANSLLR